VPVRKREIEKLSAEVRKIIDGQDIDLRDNREGALSILKNDIHTLANQKNEQVDALCKERDLLKNTLADISHQIKTPLTSMGIMVDLLETAPPEKQAEFTANIRESLNRTEWLVSALLKMAKLEADAIEFSKSEINSDDLIEMALKPLQILLDIKNQRVENVGGTSLYCDKRWTAEALTNILKNASEHSPENTAIHIQAGSNPICAWIRVSDSGSGLTETSNLFRRFKSFQNETGYGIGLPLALAIMRSQNGDIEADRGGGNTGAAFTLKFYK
jgi:K+-sensing histidine kinase KdpD